MRTRGATAFARAGWRAAAVGGVLVLAAAVTGEAAGGAGTGDTRDRWTQLGHDLSSTFHNPDASLTSGRAARLKNSSTPAVVGRRVYFGSGLSYFPPTKSGRTLYALQG